MEKGWLIEHGDVNAPTYVMVTKECLDWTKDSAKALRFARKQDAEAFVSLYQLYIEYDRIAEHVWDS